MAKTKQTVEKPGYMMALNAGDIEQLQLKNSVVGN